MDTEIKAQIICDIQAEISDIIIDVIANTLSSKYPKWENFSEDEQDKLITYYYPAIRVTYEDN